MSPQRGVGPRVVSMGSGGSGQLSPLAPTTHGIELHHLKAFAEGGEHTEENLTLRCRAHNALAAEEAGR